MANEGADKVEASNDDKKEGDANIDNAGQKVENSKENETKENEDKPADEAS